MRNRRRQSEWQEKTEALLSAKELILSANNAGFLDDDTIEKLKRAAQIECLTEEGETIPLLNDDELESITVVRGTLTDAERRIHRIPCEPYRKASYQNEI